MFRNIVLVFLFFTGIIIPQKKSSYDIQSAGLGKTGSGETYLSVENQITQVTMLKGGYFTVGTIKGKSELETDDKCQITYGHPFALTSHSLVSFDGVWYKPDDLFRNESVITKSHDTLKLTGSNGTIAYEFLIINVQDGVIQFTQNIRNNDIVNHKIGAGIVVDPALGKWGDGTLFSGGTPIRSDTLFKVKAGSQEVSVWEKFTGSKGIGFNLLSAQDYTLTASNWNSSHNDYSPVLSDVNRENLYDLLLKAYFDEIEIKAGEVFSGTVSINLESPDFSSSLFTRWDLPGYFDITDGLMFPREFDTYAEISDISGSAISCTIEPVLPSGLTSTAQQYTTSLNLKGTYQNIRLTSEISYEDQIVDAVLKIKMNGTQVDEIHRYVLIPKTPVSDSGLTVLIDTIKTSLLPKVEFTFSTKNNKTGFLISGLRKENIFLYENSSRIYDFILGPDTSGGANAADLVFALDVTGSMGNIIELVKNNIVEFADSLRAKGVDYRLGLVTFLDEVENTYNFTSDVNTFKNWISQQYAHGGGDGPENSLQALKTSSEFAFRTNCKRIIVWITDIDYHENDWATPLKKQEVIDQLLRNDIIVHSIGNEIYKSSAYDPIIIPANGKFYNIYGNFRDILLDISRMKSSSRYAISYNSSSSADANIVKLEIRYGGLGGSTEFQYSRTGKPEKEKAHLSFYPNPFNPEITFNVNAAGFTAASIRIFNILGECVKSYSMLNQGFSRITWDARTDLGSPVSTGFYIVQLVLSNSNKETYKETAKILYMR